MLVTTKQMLENALQGGYAVPAINTQGGTYDIIAAACNAAECCDRDALFIRYPG